MCACRYSALLELVQLMITKAKLDSRKRCLLVITCDRWTTIHCAAGWHSDPVFLEFLIREHSLALQTTNSFGITPQQVAIANNHPAAFTSLIAATTNSLAASDYAALVHGDESTLRCLALTPDRIAVRTSLLLCIKLGYVYVRRSKRQCNEAPETIAFDTALAFEVLNDNVWSHIMTFL